VDEREGLLARMRRLGLSGGQDDPPADPPAGDPPADPPQAGTDQPPAGDPAASGAGSEPDADDQSKANREAARYRRALRDAEKQLEAARAELSKLADEKKTEAERERDKRIAAEARIQEMEAKTRDAEVRHAVLLTASKLGVHDPEDAFRLIDRGELSFDDQGMPENIEEVLKDLIKRKPYLVGATSPNGSPANPASNGHGRGLTLDDVKKMTPEQVAANWDAAKQAVSQ